LHRDRLGRSRRGWLLCVDATGEDAARRQRDRCGGTSRDDG